MFTRSIIVASILASVAAFAPNANMRSSTQMRLNAEKPEAMDLNLEEMFEVFEEADSKITTQKDYAPSFNPSKQVGGGSPIDFFDPFSLSKDANEDTFKLWQEAETKHARVAMLAFVGIIAGEVLSGSAPLFNGAITGPAIFQFQQADAIMPSFWVGVTTIIAWIEGNTIIENWQTWEETAKDPLGRAKLAKTTIPGDLKFDPLGLKPKDAKSYATMKTKELNNGRLAMLGVAGIVAQELVTGSSIF